MPEIPSVCFPYGGPQPGQRNADDMGMPSPMTHPSPPVSDDGLDVQQVFALEAADELEQLGKRAQGMISAIPAIVAEERIEQHNLVYECEAKRWFRLAKGVRACVEATRAAPSVVVER